jgi:hypothetical protein
MAYGIRVLAETIKELAADDVDNAYNPVGSPLAHPARIVIIKNATNQPGFISFDGEHAHFYLAAGDSITLNLTTNKAKDDGLYLGKGTQVYARSSAVDPDAGSFFVTLLYGKGD